MSAIVIRTVKSLEVWPRWERGTHTEFCESYSEVLCANWRKRQEGNLKMDQRCCVGSLMEQVLKLCPMAGFGTNCVKP